VIYVVGPIEATESNLNVISIYSAQLITDVGGTVVYFTVIRVNPSSSLDPSVLLPCQFH